MTGRFRSPSMAFAALAALVALAGCGTSPATATPAAVLAPTVERAIAMPLLGTPGPTNVPTGPTNTAIIRTVEPMVALPTTAPTRPPTMTPVTAVTTPLLPTLGPTPSPTAAVAAKNLAPEIPITEPGKWFNSQPLTLAGLRGKPVFLVFWSDI